MIELIFDEADLQTILTKKLNPSVVAYSQHTTVEDLAPGVTREDWRSVEKEEKEKTRPIVYVALGSHANYFKVDEFKIDNPELWKTGIYYAIPRSKDADVTGRGKRLSPNNYQLTLLSDSTVWLRFKGLWGEWISNEPLERIKLTNIWDNGPATISQQDPWKYPLKWGMDRPDDSEFWKTR